MQSWPPASWPRPESAPPASPTTPDADMEPPVLLQVAHAVSARAAIHSADLLFLSPAPANPIPTPPPMVESNDDAAGLRRAQTVAAPAIPPKPPVETRPPRRISEPLYPATLRPAVPPPPTGAPQMPLPPPPPPIPPHPPILHTESAPAAVQTQPEDDDAELAELAAVIALSQAEEKRKRERLDREEEELRRAMEASLSPNSWSAANGLHSVQDGPSSSASFMMVATPMESEFPPQTDYLSDEELARMLAAQAPTPIHPSFSHVDDLPALNGLTPDEKFALQLAAEEEKLAREQPLLEKPPLEKPPDIPLTTKPPLPTPPSQQPQLDSKGTKSRAVSPARAKSPDGPPAFLVYSAKTSPIQPVRPLSAEVMSAPDLLSPSESSAEESDTRLASANQYVDSDLLRGVSIGFMAPTITETLVPLAGSMPNIVSLPYGRCPPLHLQAPSWRHLLRLMARLSGTRFEPTIEAMAVARSSEMHLRTVVQFVRLHAATNDWRTILWFTIDHPVPPSMPNSRKYTSGDVEVLPWSYTLSSLPALLRDSSDTLLSKCYIIPSTTSVPFPSLPISFPNMALYLQAALEESRRTSDSSTGLRKLARMVDACYPRELAGAAGELTGGEELINGKAGKMRRLLKSPFRGARSRVKGNKGAGGGGANEDMYDLVTPFVLDEWP
uniref:Uncharacterized protein n=1 Tax=Mycena chlorophos TaxID=658473 RepID=A0ABQ0M9H8_MYCCL|nr:predicted protein [Mycena chlorophos]